MLRPRSNGGKTPRGRVDSGPAWSSSVWLGGAVTPASRRCFRFCRWTCSRRGFGSALLLHSLDTFTPWSANASLRRRSTASLTQRGRRSCRGSPSDQFGTMVQVFARSHGAAPSPRWSASTGASSVAFRSLLNRVSPPIARVRCRSTRRRWTPNVRAAPTSDLWIDPVWEYVSGCMGVEPSAPTR